MERSLLGLVFFQVFFFFFGFISLHDLLLLKSRYGEVDSKLDVFSDFSSISIAQLASCY